MNIYSIPPLVVSIFTITVGLLVLIRGKKFIYFLTTFSVFIWLLGYAVVYSIQNYENALFFVRILYIGVVFIPASSYHFTITFLNLKGQRNIVRFNYLVSFIFLLLIKTDSFIPGLYKYYWGYQTKVGILHNLFLIYFVIIMSRLILFLYTCYRDKKKQSLYLEATRIRYVLISFFVSAFAAMDFLPNYGLQFYPLGFLCIAFNATVTTYAILRYRLMDINVALTRAGIFAIVYTLVLGIPFWIGIKFLGKGSWIIPVSIMAVFATAGPFIFLFLQRRAEARLFAKKRSRQDKLRDLSSYMMRFTRLKLLTNLIVHNTLKILELKHVALYLLEIDPNKTKQFNLICSYGVPQKQDLPLDISLDSALAIELTNGKTAIEFERIKHKAATANNHNNFLHLQQELNLLKAHIIIPTFLRFNLTGFLILGESRAQEAFTQEDISVLQVLSNQAALAIENALFWQRDEERLVESSKEEAASAVSFGAGHQFNNRLYAISMTVDGIFDALGERDIEQMPAEEIKPLFKKALTKLKKISEECQFGGEITAGIMSLTGTTPPNFSEFDISPIITSSIELVEMKHSKDKIEGNKPPVLITIHVPQNLPLIFGSDAQVRDCLFNLIDNAYDASYEKDTKLKEKNPELVVSGAEPLNWPQGQVYNPQIELKVSLKDNYLVIDITDNGIGVKEEDKKRIFAGFFTTKATSVKGYGPGGHGIGVFTVKKLILAHKGKISFTSEYGKGTTFTMELPLANKENNSRNA